MRPKPILAIFLQNVSAERAANMRQAVDSSLKNEYHIIVLTGCEQPDIKVYFEKDHVELDKEKLQQLLDLAIK